MLERVQHTVQQALVRTARAHPILRCRLKKANDEDPSSQVMVTELPEEKLAFDDGTFVKFEEHDEPLPEKAVLDRATVENARLPAQNDKTLFVMYVQRYRDATAFNFVLNHGFTDGTSIFYVVDSFCSNLSALLSDPSAPYTGEEVNTLRDLVGEILEHPLTKQEEDFRLTDNYAGHLTFPKVTDNNVGRETNGCIRTHFIELDSSTTSAILANCRQHGVTFQSLLSSVASLSLMKLVHQSGELDETKWNAHIVHMVPVNLRRYVSPPADGVNSSMAGSASWKQPGLKSADALRQRAFWSDFVVNDVHKPLNDCLASAYPLQFVHRLNNGKTVPPSSVIASSVGNITVVKPTYGALQVDHVWLQAGFYAASMEAYKNPAVPAPMINNAPGFVMLHAYTVFGALHVSGSYYAYDNAYIRQYYDEVVRLLTCAGSAQGAKADLTVGDMFEL